MHHIDHLPFLRQNAKRLHDATLALQRLMLHLGTGVGGTQGQTLLYELTQLSSDAGRAYRNELDRRSNAAIRRSGRAEDTLAKVRPVA